MVKPLRNDFATASVGLVGSSQRTNLGRLHDWLVDEIGIGPGEQVLAATNYQQGRFGRLPNHVLVVTNARIAFTHDGGLRSVPAADLVTDRIGLKAGIIEGEVTVLLRSGEQLTFRRGVSLSIQEVASAISGLGAWQPAPAAHQPPTHEPAPHAEPETQEDVGGWSGYGDDVLQFGEPFHGLCAIRVTGGGGVAFSVWSLSPQLQEMELLVNTTDAYSGVVLAGTQGPLGGAKVTCAAPWTFAPLDPSTLPVVGNGTSGHGDAVLMLVPDLGLLENAAVLDVQAHGAGATSLWSYGTVTDLLVNQVGTYSGSVIAPQGTQLLALKCDGPWSLGLR